MVIDFHAHVFNGVQGQNVKGKTVSGSFGEIICGNHAEKFLPGYFEKTAFPVKMLVELMDQAGIGRALLLQNPTIGLVNDTLLEAVRSYPDRFRGSIQVDPADPNGVETLCHYAAFQNMCALKLEMSHEWGWSGIHPGLLLESPQIFSLGCSLS